MSLSECQFYFSVNILLNPKCVSYNNVHDYIVNTRKKCLMLFYATDVILWRLMQTYLKPQNRLIPKYWEMLQAKIVCPEYM